MAVLYQHCGCKRLQKRLRFSGNPGVRLTVLFLCLSVMACFCPTLTMAEESGEKLSDIVEFDSITLHYPGSDGRPEGEAVQDGALFEPNQRLVLRYMYKITEDQCSIIEADVPYYLEVSPHLVLPDLKAGSPLTVENEDGKREPFGMIYADGSRAWVTFDADAEGNTILSDYGGLNNGDFYLNCRRAGNVPPGEPPVEGNRNLYAMRFEDNSQLNFGYAENEPVTAEACIKKQGKMTDKTLTWTISYTPWQNPDDSDDVTLETPFELRDTIDTSLHTYVEDSVKIDGSPVADFASRDEIQDEQEAYVIAETKEDGSGTTLTFGGTLFNAGEATQGDPAKPLKITYQTTVNEELLLPGSSGGEKITNAAELFAGDGDLFFKLDVKGSDTVTVPQPEWLTKTGKTIRHTDGSGSTTDWTVTFQPNGFEFTEDNRLTLYDQLPPGSTLVNDSVCINGIPASAEAADDQSFTVFPIIADSRSAVIITYQTCVPEEMYDSGTSLGNNTAWFTFLYGDEEYTTPTVVTPVGSGDGSGTPGTATLVKTNSGYNKTDRTISWMVKINPHQAYLKSGTFTDDFSIIGPRCSAGHSSGLELMGDVKDIAVKVNGRDPSDAENALIDLKYDLQCLTIQVGEIGAKSITLEYTTKVCDPCVFANNTKKTAFKNTISTNNMMIGSSSATGRSASADSTADVSSTVLNKKAPVYNYVTGMMEWVVEVNGAGLPMADIVLTDELPAGLTFVEDSFTTDPEILGASASMQGQTLTVTLGSIAEKTTVAFNTKADPEILGFGGDKPVLVANTIYMNGSADNITFGQVAHSVQQSFSNHGLAKSSIVNNQEELIRYEVLINPFGLALPENPALVDTLDKRLQLDRDTLFFYKADLSGTTVSKDQKPGYTKIGNGQPLKIADYDPQTNSFKVQLPIGADSREAYVLSYTADIIQREAGSYGNGVRFEGGSVLLGGSKNNSAAVGGGGGGGGGGAAARKAGIAITKADSETQEPLPGVTFTLYQWDSKGNTRGMPFACKTTDTQGMVSFKVKPEEFYELVETESISGYGKAIGWKALPDGVTETKDGLLIKAGAAKSEMKLELTNEAHTTDIVFRLVNGFDIPMAGTKVQIFKTDPGETENPVPDMETLAAADGTVRFLGMRRGAVYYIRLAGGEVMTATVPDSVSEKTEIMLPDGTTAVLTDDYKATGIMGEDQQWALVITRVISGSTTPLAGASIGLYADADCRVLIKTGVSGQDGRIIFEGLMRNQTYWLKEIAVPSGYQLNNTIYEGSEAKSSMTIENKTVSQNPDGSGGADNPENPDMPSDPALPQEPTVPSDPALPQEPTVPSDPALPQEPTVPSKPAKPSDSGRPKDPVRPYGSSRPRYPASSYGTVSSDNSGSVAAPGSPGSFGPSGAFGGPGNPGPSSASSGPGNPGPVAAPGSPDNSDLPAAPGSPDNPGLSVTLGSLYNSGMLEESGTPDGLSAFHGQSEDGIPEKTDSPQTGDSTSWPATVVFISGLLLAVMTLYRIIRMKRYEGK